ncbi:MAG: beta strand repeat-containing protein [Lentimicrobium sp.]
MKTQLLKIILLLLLIALQGFTRAQTITTTAGSVTSCPGEVLVPLNVTNCNGIGAISLVLDFNSTCLTFLGYQNLNSALSSGLLIVNSTGNRVFIIWANSTAANVGNGTLMQLRFTAVPGTSSLTWDTQTPGNCEYSNTSGTVLPAAFVNGTATINQPPVINTQPVNVTALVGQNTGFSLSATGTGIAYLWQLSTNGGSTWGDLANNSTYSGVTTASLGITNAQLTYNGYRYRCRLTGTCTPVVYSDVVTLTVINPVTTTLPTASNCPGSITVPVTVTNFTSVASFSLSFSYNTTFLTYTGYQALNGALSGGVFVANAANGIVYLTWYSTTAATFGNGTIVELLFTATTGISSLTWNTTLSGSCEYTALNGTTITSVFVNGNETIYGLPAVVNHPANSTIAKGQNTSFSVTATGSGLSYLWQLSTNGGSSYTDLANGGVYSNVTNATMNITNAQLGMSGYRYRCRVTGTCSPVVFSNPAILTVLPNIITVSPTVTNCPGSITIPINVTDFTGVAAFSLVLKYNTGVLTFTGTQNLNAALTGGSFSANATGGNVYLVWSNTSAANIANGQTLVELKFDGIPGSSTLNWDSQTPGNCEYSDVNGLIIFSTWTNGNATINTPPAITTQPVDRTIYSGGNTTFSVQAAGTGLSYIWQVSTNGGASWTNLTNVSPYSGVSTATLSINPAALSMNGYRYHCIVAGTCPPSVISGQAILTVTVPAITTTAGSITNSCTGSLVIPISVTNCTNVGAFSLALNYDPAKLTFDGYQSPNAALTPGILAVNTTGTKVLLTWASNTPANIGSGVLIQLRFRGNGGVSTTLTWDTQTPGYCEYSDATGFIITSFYVNGTVTIASNAIVANAGNDVSIFQGNNTQLSASATGGVTPYTYLWSPAATLSNPNIPNPVATPSTTTTYTVTITGNNGCSANDQVKVTVLKSLNVTVFLEGLYIGGGVMQQANDENGPHFGAGIADQVIIELHNQSDYNSIAYTSPLVNLSTTGIVNVGVPTELNASYYLTISHRNSIETTTANPVSFSGSSISYNFSTAASQALGSNQKEISGLYVIYSGDVNQDGVIDTADMTPIDNDSSSYDFGYLSTDVNGDGIIDTADMTIVYNNAANYIGRIVP